MSETTRSRMNMEYPPPYTCPRCGRVSHDPTDSLLRYCGACHRFEGRAPGREDVPTGPTGEFPEGKLRDDDEGEAHIAVGFRKGVVVIDFGKPTAWVGMPPGTARQLAMHLLRHAASIDGLPVSFTIGGGPGKGVDP